MGATRELSDDRASAVWGAMSVAVSNTVAINVDCHRFCASVETWVSSSKTDVVCWQYSTPRWLRMLS